MEARICKKNFCHHFPFAINNYYSLFCQYQVKENDGKNSLKLPKYISFANSDDSFSNWILTNMIDIGISHKKIKKNLFVLFWCIFFWYLPEEVDVLYLNMLKIVVSQSDRQLFLRPNRQRRPLNYTLKKKYKN